MWTLPTHKAPRPSAHGCHSPPPGQTHQMAETGIDTGMVIPADCRAPGNRERLGRPERASWGTSGKLLPPLQSPHLMGSSRPPTLVQM